MHDEINWDVTDPEHGFATLEQITELVGDDSLEPLAVWLTDRLTDAIDADAGLLATIEDGHLLPLVIVGDIDIERDRAIPLVSSVPGFVSLWGIGECPSTETIRAGRATLAAPTEDGTREGVNRYRSMVWASAGSAGVIVGLSREADAFDDEQKSIAISTGQTLAALASIHTEESGVHSLTEDPLEEEIADILSHDLRNKIAIARGRLDLAQRTGEQEHLDDIGLALERMESIVDMVVTILRSGLPITDLEVVDLRTVAETVHRSLDTDKATLAVTASASILADPRCLEQLLDNVFRNAIDHSTGSVRIEVGLLADGFYIADTGPGIPTDIRDDVLEPGVSTGQDHDGAGLAIVKRLASAHGWDVTLTESESGGTRVEIGGVAFC